MVPPAVQALLPRPAASLVERLTTWVLLAAILAGGLLRFVDLDRRSIGHPENNVPRLVVPSWAQQPTPRDDLSSVLRGNIHDGHPPAWFVGMYAWTGVAGTALTAVRLPSAIFGALSLLLLYLVARRLVDRPTALLATALLACCGMHVFWSQIARMYSASCFFGLASTLFLIDFERSPRRRTGLLYAACAAIGLWMQIYAWPLLFGQILWTASRSVRQRAPSPALSWQFLAVIAGSPVIALALHQNPGTRWHESAAEYFDLGYAFLGHAFQHGPPLDSPLSRAWIRCATLGLLVIGLFGRPRVPGTVASDATRPEPAWIFGMALTVSAAIAAFAFLAPARPTIGRTGLLLVATLPVLLAAFSRAIERLSRWLPSWWFPRKIPLDVFLGVVPLLLMALLSEARGVLVARGAVVFLPYLMIGVASGVASLARAGIPRAVPIAALLAVQFASTRYHWHAQADSVDYRGLARAMAPLVRSDDFVLAHNFWRTTPLYYDTTVGFDRFLVSERAAALAQNPRSRAWVILFDRPGDAVLLDMLKDYRAVGEVRAFGIAARLFEPPDGGAGEPDRQGSSNVSG
ncbi:MAG: glycosyltransferase family 39 protein [Planctomycetota bacterium]